MMTLICLIMVYFFLLALAWAKTWAKTWAKAGALEWEASMFMQYVIPWCLPLLVYFFF
jgi:hypothetical protein